MTLGARKFLCEQGTHLWDREISSREIHASAMISGSTAAENDPTGTTAREISELWEHLEYLSVASTSEQIERRGRRGARR